MASSEQLRKRNPRGQGGVLKTQLVDATAMLLATLEHPETLTLRQVAREVGIAPASIYSHFPDLGALVNHVLRLHYDELGRQMQQAADAATRPLADLTARCSAYVHWGVEQPGPYKTLFGSNALDEIVAKDESRHPAGADLLGSVIESLADAVTPDRTQKNDQGRWQAGLLLWTALHGLVSLYAGHGDLGWPPLDDMIADIVSLHSGHPWRDVAKLI